MLKERYFTEKNIETEAGQFVASIKELRSKHEWTFNPSSSALLVLDMQDFFLQENSHAFIPSGRAVIPRIKRLQELFSAHSCAIIQTRHINNSTNAGRMSNWWTELITENNPLSQISTFIRLRQAQTVIKTQYDAFFDTELHRILMDNKVTQVFITGVMTHLCCETTARAAFIRGFEVFFVIDGTATYNRQFHLSTLLNLAHGFAVPVMTEEVITGFKRRDK
jgi:isochorismate hydrolase